MSTTLVLDETSRSKPTPRNCFVDGPISVYQKVNADGSNAKVYMYVGMRRGGRLIYALDVTDPTQLKFVWKTSNTDTDNRFSLLGQTWSEPRVTKIKGHADPVLVMGGATMLLRKTLPRPAPPPWAMQSMCWMPSPAPCSSGLIQHAAVPADATLVNSGYDGSIDRAYAVDTGGNTYRIDLETSTPSVVADWGIYKLAALAGTDTRMFFYAPDVVPTKTFTAVQVGSGNREMPLKSTTTGSDGFFTVFDTAPQKALPLVSPRLFRAHWDNRAAPPPT